MSNLITFLVIPIVSMSIACSVFLCMFNVPFSFILDYPEGPYIQLLGNLAPKYHTIEGIMGPNSRMVVYVDPLGYLCGKYSFACSMFLSLTLNPKPYHFGLLMWKIRELIKRGSQPLRLLVLQTLLGEFCL